MALIGRARDIVTARSGGKPLVIAEDSFRGARLSSYCTILAISAARSAVADLVGTRGGGHLRHVIDEAMPEERRAATPLPDSSTISRAPAWWQDGPGRSGPTTGLPG